MHARRNTLKLLLGGLAVCASAPVYAAAEMAVYHSPD